MHFHESLVAKLVDLYSTYGGFKDESRLRTVLRDLKLDAVKTPDGKVHIVYSGDTARGPR
jgi:hypothetical protein